MHAESISFENEEDRITMIGKFLRKTSLDELPTFWNTFIGDMSIVGPRPLLERYIERYNDFQIRRLEVKPGITGLAQINGRNLLSWEKKFEYDVFYVDNNNFYLDLKIIILTIVHLFFRKGINTMDEKIMPEFLGVKKTNQNLKIRS